MTDQERELCRNLIIETDGKSRISKAEFLRQFPAAVEDGRLAPDILEKACTAQNPEDLQCALTIGFTFGFSHEHLGPLSRLIDLDWHYSHEDVVTALETWPTPETVEALFHATQWIPKSLEYDDFRALAVKAIWALGKIPGPEAERKLELLTKSDNEILQRNAKEQLERRHKAT